MSTAHRLVHRLPDRLDGYTLRALLGPLLLALTVLLLAMILVRLLRLFDVAAATGASPLLVAKMVASLLPHYLGMALPAAFFTAIFMSVARIGDDSELDAMLATGRSIARMAVPYFLVAVALVGFNFYLFGFLQPLTRYGYNADLHAAQQTGWNARMEDNRFVTVKRGYTLGASTVGPDGRQLAGVFVERRDERGEEIITAQRGRLEPSADGARLLLGLNDGLIMADRPDGSVRTVQFGDIRLNEDFTAMPPPYRARGVSVRELTLPELRANSAGRPLQAQTDDRDAGRGDSLPVATNVTPPEILELFADAEQNLKAAKCDDYYRDQMSPNFRKNTGVKAQRKLVKACQNSAELREQLIRGLQLARAGAPRFQNAGTRAVYNLGGQDLPYPALIVEQVNQRWYIVEGFTAGKLAGEFHGRVAWTVLPLLLPLLALPLGMAAKRGRRAPGVVFASLALLSLYQALQFGESLGETGRAPAWLAVWLPVTLFGVFGIWLFRSSLQWPGDNPVMRAVSAIEAGFEGLHRRKKK